MQLPQYLSHICRIHMRSVGPIIARYLSNPSVLDAGTGVALVEARSSRPILTEVLKMMIRKLTPRLVLLATVTLIAAGANAQTSEHDVKVTIRPSQTVEQRVADEIKARELKNAAEERTAAEEAARIAETNPKGLLASARVVYIFSDTSFFEEVQLQNALRKRPEFETWQMAIVDGRGKPEVADVRIEIDRPLFTYTFTYQIINRSNGIVLATGKVTAFDGNDAAPKLAQRIIDDIRVARGEGKTKK